MATPSDISVGLAHEFAITACRAGWEPEDFTILAQSEDKLRELLPFIRGCGELVAVEQAKPPLLQVLGTVSLPALPRFVAREHFVRDTSDQACVKIAYIWDNFRAWLFPKVEEPIGESSLSYARLLRASVDGPIRKKIGHANEETTLAQIWALLKKQPSGEACGPLLTNGYANIFYVRSGEGELCAVGVGWRASGRGWHVLADRVSDPNPWFDGDRVFSSNS